MTVPSHLARVWAQYDELLAAGVQTIPQLLLHQATRHRGRVLHRRKDFGIWQRYTWEDVVSRVRNIAMGLAALGVQRGETVAVVGENEPELFWCEYAAHCVGAKIVCLYPDLTAAQMEYVLQHSEAVALMCEDQEQIDKALELEAKLPLLHTIVYWDARGMWKYAHPKLQTLKSVGEKGRAFLAQHPTAFDAAVAAGKGSDIAVLSYTSGTTGNPKACILTHHYLLEAPARIIGALDFKPYTQYLSYISPAWATEQFFGLAIALVVPFIVNFPEEPETVQDNIREIGAEALMLSPRQLESLYTHVEAKMMDAEDHQTALSLGISVKRSIAAAWALSGVFSTLAAIIFLNGKGMTFLASDIGFAALPVALLAGLESIGGVVLGGLIVGIASALAAYFLDPVFDGGVAGVFPFLIMVVILLIRPTGLFGWKTIERI